MNSITLLGHKLYVVIPTTAFRGKNWPILAPKALKRYQNLNH